MQEVSSEEDELSDEEYIPQSESENQSASSDQLATKPRPSYEQTKLLSHTREAASSKIIEALRSDAPTPNISKGKGKGVLQAREAACMKSLTYFAMRSNSYGECHNPRKQCSEVCRSADVLMSSPRSHKEQDSSDKHLNAKRAAVLREELSESSATVISSELLNRYNRTTVISAGNLRLREGALKMKRAPKRECDAKQFVHCMYCKGIFVMKDLWRHLKRCPSKPAADGENQGRMRVLGLAHISRSLESLSLHSRSLTNMDMILANFSTRLLLTLRREFSIYSLKEAICEIIHCRALMSEDKELITSTETFKNLYSSK
ncbi:Transmembrane protein 68 [Labeo rohita]|uniref:Transmembrane protein 68 n=1 Tax=Labeo rohita TaxID=84645 RepID=A0ABQ8LRL8_LABRO|nr:Transmembrane protein 68 [Labeo rohita]